jgi:anti-sigma factor RsiW
MECEALRDRLVAYAAGRLPTDGRAEVRIHLETCAACRRVAEAEAELTAALAEATTQLTRLDVAQWRPELAGALQALRRPESTATLPVGFDPRARRLFARASILDQVLTLAEHSAPGGAVNGYEAQQRDAALRPLTTACRQALMAACNSPLRP